MKSPTVASNTNCDVFVWLEGPVQAKDTGSRAQVLRGEEMLKEREQEESLPPQMPQLSRTLRLLGTPSQPVQVELLPPHTPHASSKRLALTVNDDTLLRSVLVPPAVSAM